MKGSVEIAWINLMFGYFALVIPFFIIAYFKTGLLKSTIISIGRMSVQLFFIGIYLEFLFRLENDLVNIAWAIIMVLLASGTVVKRSGLSLRLLYLPVILSMFISIGFTALWYILIVIQPDNFFDARFLIPIIGMLIGNSLRSNVVAMNVYFKAFKKEQTLYRYALANGATHREATLSFKQEAIKAAVNPMIGQTAIMGLISLPGVLTGQILGGQDPSSSIKYQLVIVLAIFVMSILNLTSILVLSNRFIFDETLMLKQKVFRINA